MMKKWVNIDGSPKDWFDEFMEEGFIWIDQKRHGKLTEKYGYIALFAELKLWTMISETSVIGKIREHLISMAVLIK